MLGNFWATLALTVCLAASTANRAAAASGAEADRTTGGAAAAACIAASTADRAAAASGAEADCTTGAAAAAVCIAALTLELYSNEPLMVKYNNDVGCV